MAWHFSRKVALRDTDSQGQEIAGSASSPDSLCGLRALSLKRAFFTGLSVTLVGYMLVMVLLESNPGDIAGRRVLASYHDYDVDGLVYDEVETRNHENHDDGKYEENNKPAIHSVHSKTNLPVEGASVHKVLFLGYSRGGSSISSEIFDVDPRAVQFYEPLDAFYFAHTGYYGRKNQRALLYANESDFRPPERWEYTEMALFFKDMLSCNLHKLPVEFVGHRNTRHTSALDDYRYCYADNLNPGMKFNSDLRSCREILRDICGYSVETAIQNGCHDIMGAIHTVDHYPDGSGDSEKAKIMAEHLQEQGYERSFISKRLETMLRYRSCTDKMRPVIRKCIGVAEKNCKAKGIRTVKLVRYTMPLIKHILREIPNLSVVLFIRDPRAVAYSRANPKELAYSRNDRDKLEAETFRNLKYVCNKYRKDLSAYVKESYPPFPESIHVIKYEDFVVSPYREAELMYAHIGEKAPGGILEKFISDHMFAAKDDGRIWGNVRTNATENAEKWRGQLSSRLIAEMEKHCADVLRKLDYPLYEHHR